MKPLYFLLATLFSTGILYCQTTKFEGRIVTENEVPEEVIDSHTANFGNKKVIRWKKQESIGRKGNKLLRYVSVMKEGKRPLSNARYAPDGELIFYAEYYGSKNVPEFLLPDLKSSFSGYRITGGTHIKLYKTKKEYYRIRLKGGSTITYVFYDKNGNQVDRNTLPKDAEF
ncbi:MAG: hypothetical protein AAGA43_10840 [Bacteroidota bacterium]